MLALIAFRLQAGDAATRPAMVSQGLVDGQLRLTLGRSAIVTTTRPYKRVAVADAEIVAAPKPVGLTSVLLTPKKAGMTQFMVWDDDEHPAMIDVVVEADLGELRERYRKLFPDAKIEVATVAGTMVLRGRAPNAQAAEQAAQLAEPYGLKVLNMLEVAGGRQVMLQVRFAEVSRSATSALGVNLGFSDGRSFAGSNIGQLNPLGIVDVGQNASDLGVLSPNPSVTLFGRATNGDAALLYFINALRQNNLLRILAEPNLTTTSGQTASFQAGGEFAIPVAQSSGAAGGTAAITVEYRKYGVQLTFVPVVLGDGRIRLKVEPEVSDLDFANAVRINGFLIPGLTTRRVETTVELAEGQTFAIAGLLNDSVVASKEITPLLGDLPAIGALFRSVRYQRKETELVVLVTPKLVEGMNPDEVPALPGDDWKHPTENELFWQAQLGAPDRTGVRPPTRGGAPKFFGEYGFQAAKQPSPGPEPK